MKLIPMFNNLIQKLLEKSIKQKITLIKLW
jgi:hypothetical protein